MSELQRSPLSRAETRSLFLDALAGAGDFLGALEGSPVIVVDLDLDPHEPLPKVPDLFGAVVLGIGRLSSPADLDGLDVVLGPVQQEGSVASNDPYGEATELARKIAASPEASITLCHILRAGAGLKQSDALLYESLAFSALQSSSVFRAWLANRPAHQNDDRSDDDRLVHVARQGDVLTLTLQRPERHNALGSALRDALFSALDLALEDPSIDRVELRGAGPHFSSGGDLTEFGLADDGGHAHLVRVARSVGLRVGALAPKVTAYLHGKCVGAGIEIPAFAGQVIATHNTQIQLPEIAMGLIPGAGGTVSIPRRIGRHRTAWLSLSGEWLGVQTAKEWGLVDALDNDA